MSTPICCFPPIANAQAQILILGSMPGVASLQQQQYYAHPRNQFWRIMSHLLQQETWLDYPHKVTTLLQKNIALWDVIQSCQRTGSLDSAIAKNSIIPNDFASFLQQHPGIQYVYFNGATAEQAFKQWVLPNLSAPSLQLQRLPSSSPAHAGLSLQQKLEQWQVLLSP